MVKINMKALLYILLTIVSFTGLSQQLNEKTIIGTDIELIKISENILVHISYFHEPTFGRFPSNGLVFIQNKKAFLFDTPMTDSLTQVLVSWLQDSLHVSVVGFVPNHWHNDCMGGLRYLQRIGIKSWANQMTIDKAIAENLPVPDTGFTDSLTIDFEGKDIKCYYFGAAHSLDNIVVYLPSEKILFAGCMAKEIYSKNLGNTIDGDLNEYPKTISKVISRFQDAEIIIPGHGNFGRKKLLFHTLELSKKQK